MGPAGRAIAVVVLAVAVVASAITPARAQPNPAEQAFRDGRNLLAAGRTAEACARFEESQRLEPAAGTLLNLGSCYEKLGRTASAWEVFRKIEALESDPEQARRAAEAGRRARLLEPTLCKLRVTASARVPGLTVRLDDSPIQLVQGDIPVDPGAHRVEASAPGRTPWKHTVTVDRPGKTITVAIPDLARPAVATPPRSAGDDDGDGRSGREMSPLAWGLAGGGGLALGVAAILDVTAYRDLTDCRDAGGCETEADIRSIDNRLLAGDILLGIGVASLATAAVLYWISDDSDSGPVDVGIVPAPGATSLVIGGEF